MKINYQQIFASDPQNSVWVSASAGTGKTKILVDRIIRLALDGVDIRKVLCITYTKAAANEMKDRLESILFSWTSLNETDLLNELLIIIGRTPDRNIINQARRLYSSIYKDINDLNIQTIHSLCQSILQRFSLEADITEDFSILTSQEVEKIISHIIKDIFFYVTPNEATKFILQNFHDVTVEKFIRLICFDHARIKRFINISNNKDQYIKILKLLFDIKRPDNKIFDKYKVIDIYHINLQKDLKILELYNRFINNRNNYNLKELYNLLFTLKGSIRAKLFSKSTLDKYPQIVEQIKNFQEDLFYFYELEKDQRLIECSAQFYSFVKVVIDLYNKYTNSLSYDEIIYKTLELLTLSDMKDWVLYKLDGGFDHILVDEAQDTSPLQWEIIKGLVDNFFYSDISKLNRSLFIVGDDKQSIYSFQGADSKYYNSLYSFFSNKMKILNKKFNFITLDVSYRSAKSIIEYVDYVISYIKLHYSSFADINYQQLNLYKTDLRGRVEVWPVNVNDRRLISEWPLPHEALDNKNNIILCKDIVNYIAEEVKSKNQDYGDIMILVRKRDNFISSLINEFDNYSIPHSGIDRIDIQNDLSIKDILSLCDFVLSPDNDLNLCSLLLSPIFNLSDQDLHSLCIKRNDASLWEYLNLSRNDVVVELEYYITLYKNNDLLKFFQVLLYGTPILDRLIKYNGRIAEETINELLYLVEEYVEQNSINSLFSFLYYFKNSELKVKREQRIGDYVNISTVHGSKGLESKTVILVDNSFPSRDLDNIYWVKNYMVFPGKSSNISLKLSKFLFDRDNQMDEYFRLLYVALTRAKQNLIICGYTNNKVHKDSWYNICLNALLPYGNFVKEKLVLENQTFLDNNIKVNQLKKNFYTIKRIDEDNNINFNLLNNFQKGTPYIKIDYGSLFHSIIENILNYWNKNKVIDIVKFTDHIDLEYKNTIKMKLSILFKDKYFQKLISNYFLYPEISFIYNNNIFRIDLLCIGTDDIIIIDYKTDIIVPLNSNNVNKEYSLQMEKYKQVVESIYKEKEIKLQILWLDNIKFMDL